MNLIEKVSVGNLVFGEGLPKICVPITGRTKGEIITQTKKIKEAAPDLVEWRGDLFEDIMEMAAVEDVLLSIHEILEEIPLLFTFRSKKEGGGRDISLEEYLALNLKISESEYVHMMDVEVFMNPGGMGYLIELLKKNGKAVIGSHHRFDCTPSKETMVEVLKNIEEAGADILKLAVMPQDNQDVELLLQATNEAVCIRVNHPVVTMSMGAMGVKSRICGEVYGSSMTFACVGETSAPGQIKINELRAAMQEVHKIVEKI